jgi:hypothetical protein
LYGRLTWSFAWREENKASIFQSRPQRDEVTGKWRKFHIEKLNDLYSQNIIHVLKSRRWAGYVTRVGEIRGA